MRSRAALAVMAVVLWAPPAVPADAPPATPSAAVQAGLDAAARLEVEGRFDDAESAYRQVLAAGPSCEATRGLARLIIDRKRGSIVEAITLVRQVIHDGCAQAKDYRLAAEVLGNTMGGEGDKEEAGKYWEAGFRIDPGDPDIAKHYGGYLERKGRVADAIAVYSTHLRIHPDAAVFYFFLAGCRSSQGRCADAEAYYKRFLNYAGDLPDIAKSTWREQSFKKCQSQLGPMVAGVDTAQRMLQQAHQMEAQGAPLERVIDVISRATEVAKDWAILYREAGRLFILKAQKAGPTGPDVKNDLDRALRCNVAYLRMVPFSADVDDLQAVNARLRAQLLAMK